MLVSPDTRRSLEADKEPTPGNSLHSCLCLTTLSILRLFSACKQEAFAAAYPGSFIIEATTNALITLALTQSGFFTCNIEKATFA